MGNVNKSPEDCFSLMLFFASSTPKSPPNKPPIIVLVLNKFSREETSEGNMGFSKNPTMREPRKAPIAAPKIMDNRFIETMGSVVRFRKKT